MKKQFFILASLLLSAATFVQAQMTAEEIVSTYLENIGGAEQLAEIETMVIIGNTQAQGMEFPMTMYQTADGAQRMDMTFQGKEMTQMAFDGEEGWGINFMTGKPEKMDAEQSKMIAAQTEDFPDAFLNYKEKGYTVELVDENADVEGTPAYKVKLTRKPMTVEGEEVENFAYYYFDKDAFIPIMQEEFAKAGPAKGQASQTFTSDYQEVSGIYMPFSISQKMNGATVFSMAIEEIKVNEELDDELFEFPEDAEEEGDK